MQKFIINSSVHGYDSVNITETSKLEDIKNALVVLIFDKTCVDKLSEYYVGLEYLLKNLNRVLLIGIEDNAVDIKPQFKSLASLLVIYKGYDIYYVPDSSTISAPYLKTLEERKPDILEVQNYIGGDITAYNDLVRILFGIESMVENGQYEELKKFLEDNMLSIENFTSTINYMKKKCEMFNSGELMTKIDELNGNIKSLEESLKENSELLQKTKHERDEAKVAVSTLTRENNSLKIKNTELTKTDEYSANVIKMYNTLSTTSINCRTKFIIYFKEISYVPYVNTLITQLGTILNTRRLKIKTLIYDTPSSLHITYQPIAVIDGRTYANMKDNVIHKLQSAVITEANQNILEDILKSDECFDVLIIYDRMKDKTDLVTGNNVTKFYVINSCNDFNKVSKMNKITDTSYVITHAHTTITDPNNTGSGSVRNTLDIPYVAGFSTMTDSAKTNKYIRMMTTLSKQPLINTILSKARINTLINI